jgi:hypothetical protein
MMRSALYFLILLLLAHNAQAFSAAPSQLIQEQPTEQESREAREVAAAFIKRMQETRDVAALKDLYVDDFLGLESGLLPLGVLGLSLSQRTDLWAEVDRRVWERFYAAEVNLNYFRALYYLANGRNILTHEPKVSELYPPEVIRLFDANPFLAVKSPDRKHKIETLEELRGLLSTLEQATAMMRERIVKHAPEETLRYRENVRAWMAKEPEEAVYIQTGPRRGFPEGTRFFRLRTSPEIFDLTLVRTTKGMKIAWAKVYVFN